MSDTGRSNKKIYRPDIGNRYGFLYPVTWRLLDYGQLASIYYWLNFKTAIGSDIYVATCWLLELVCLWVVGRFDGVWVWIVIVFCAYRYLDVMNVLLSILVRGFIKHDPRGQGRSSANRTVLLILANGIEIFVLFSVLALALYMLFPISASLNQPISGSIDALYYSVVTGATLGFGDIYPKGLLSKTMAIVEVLSIFLVFVIVVGTIASQRKPIPDLNDTR